MSILKSAFVAWTIFLLSLLAWGSVGYVAYSLSGADTLVISGNSAEEEESARLETALRLRAVARETTDLRAALETATSVDVVSIVDAVEAVGRDARVSLEIGQVFTEPLANPASSEAPNVRTVNMAVDAEGTFSSLMHAAALLHTLPVPSEVEQIQFELLPESAAKKGTWHLVVHLRILTAADISS